MNRAAAGAALAGSIVVCLLGVGSAVIATQTAGRASDSLQGALRLHGARLSVARAQEKLGESDIASAIEAARSANATALRVGRLTDRIAALLGPTRDAAIAATRSGRRGARGAAATRRQTEAAAEVLGAIAGYQTASSDDARATNRSLRRILAALRRTNENFGPP